MNTESSECDFWNPFEAFKDWSCIQEKALNWVWQEGRNIINYVPDWPKTCQFCKYYTFIYNYINVFLPLDDWVYIKFRFWRGWGCTGTPFIRTFWKWEMPEFLSCNTYPSVLFLGQESGIEEREIYPTWIQKQDKVCWDGSWPVQCWL